MFRFIWNAVGIAALTLSINAVSASAASAVTVNTCGEVVKSVVKTEANIVSTTSKSFVPIPGADAFVHVARNTTGCIKVRFSANTVCEGPNITPRKSCYFRVLMNDVQMRPNRDLHLDDKWIEWTYESLSHEWVNRVRSGDYRVSVEWYVWGEPGTRVATSSWTLDVELTR